MALNQLNGRSYICAENRRDMSYYEPHVLSMETYASEPFEKMHHKTFCYKHAMLTLKAFMHIIRIIYKSISQQQQDIFLFKRNIKIEP